MSSSNRFKEILNKAEDDAKRCWFCHKSEDEIRAEFIESMKKPENADKEIDMDEVLLITYKTKKPICAGCYFHIRNNEELVDEIFQRPESEVWGIEDGEEKE